MKLNIYKDIILPDAGLYLWGVYGCLSLLYICSTSSMNFFSSFNKNALISGLIDSVRCYWRGVIGECTIKNIFLREFLFLPEFSLLARSNVAMPSKVAENRSLCQKKSLRFLFCWMCPFSSNPSINSQTMQTLRPNRREIACWVLDFTLTQSINLSSYR